MEGGSASQLLISLLPYTAEQSNWTVHKQGVGSWSLYPQLNEGRLAWHLTGFEISGVHSKPSLRLPDPMLFPGLSWPPLNFAIITITQLPGQGNLTPALTPCSTCSFQLNVSEPNRISMVISWLWSLPVAFLDPGQCHLDILKSINIISLWGVLRRKGKDASGKIDL